MALINPWQIAFCQIKDWKLPIVALFERMNAGWFLQCKSKAHNMTYLLLWQEPKLNETDRGRPVKACTQWTTEPLNIV